MKKKPVDIVDHVNELCTYHPTLFAGNQIKVLDRLFTTDENIDTLAEYVHKIWLDRVDAMRSYKH